MNTVTTETSLQVTKTTSNTTAIEALDALARMAHEGIVDPSKQLVKCDFRDAGEPWEKRREFGKSLREKTPRESHSDWQPAADRPDPVDIVIATNAGRQAHLIPLRMSRMAALPFAFLRGSVAIMAWDLAGTPATGVNVVMNGDAHINNFGLYGTPQRDAVIYLNDFDEVTIGPWEWDLKRLIASINVLGRENGLNRRERRLAVTGCVEGYRERMKELQDMGVLDLWYLHNVVDRLLDPKALKIDSKSRAIIKKAAEKALKQNNASLLGKVAERAVNGAWRFKEDPPELTSIDEETRGKIIDALNVYSTTVAPERRFMLHRYHVADVAHRVVGVGSVGTRAYLALLFGNGDDDPVFLQIKEALPPAHGQYLPPLPEAFAHDGLRVIKGQKVLQASSDPLLGWTTIDDRPFYVRQMKNLKGSIPMEWLSGTPFNFFSRGAGILLARAHARTGDAAVIAGYCGGSDVLDEALADWAEAYGEQTVDDHAALLKAIESGRVIAE
jgi:uncharacterized protein (DUF2252 family)